MLIPSGGEDEIYLADVRLANWRSHSWPDWRQGIVFILRLSPLGFCLIRHARLWSGSAVVRFFLQCPLGWLRWVEWWLVDGATEGLDSAQP